MPASCCVSDASFCCAPCSVLRTASKDALRSEIVGDQLLLPLEIHGVEIDVGLCLFDLGLHVAVAGLQGEEIVARITKLRFGPL